MIKQTNYVIDYCRRYFFQGKYGQLSRCVVPQGTFLCGVVNRVWKGILGIRDLTKVRWENRENDKYLVRIRDLTAPWIRQNLGMGCRIFSPVCCEFAKSSRSK